MKAIICVLTNHFLPNHGKTLRVGCLWGHKQRRKLKEIYNALTPIQERHAKLLAAFAQEREPLKEKWRAEMNEIIAQYNAQVNPYLQAFFAKHNFGNYDDEDAFLLLRNVLPTKQEAGAGAGEED